MNEKYLTVSDEFVEIYKWFNVIERKEAISKLSRKERLLLLILSIDSFSEDNTALIENCRDYKEDVMLILDLQEDKEVSDSDLKELAKLTSEKYIDTSCLRDSKGNKLPDPLTEPEAITLRRDIALQKLEIDK